MCLRPCVPYMDLLFSRRFEVDYDTMYLWIFDENYGILKDSA